MGGGERVLWHLARGLVACGHEVRILVPLTKTAWPLVSETDGVTVLRYDDPWHSFSTLYLPSIWLARTAVRRLARTWRPDVVHASQGISGLGADWAGARPLCYTFYGPWYLEFLSDVTNSSGMPVVKRWTRALWAPAKARLARSIERAAVDRSERVIVLSTFSERQLADAHRVAGARVVRIPGGVDLTLFAPKRDRESARRSLRLPAAGPLLFTVRRLVPRMGLEGLVRALAFLPGVQLVIGGDGPLRARLEHVATALRVADRVRFAGFIEDGELPLYYRAADLVALPSIALEGFGLIALEALACGTPVVTTPGGGTTDILADFQPSWIAANASPEAFAGCVSAALAQSAAEADLDERCRAHATLYPWERMVERHVDLYRELLGRGA